MSTTSTAVTSHTRNAVRLVFASAAFTFGIVLLGGRAHAADPPPAEAPPGSASPAPPADSLLAPAPAPAPADPAPAPSAGSTATPPVDLAPPPAPAGSADPGTPSTAGSTAAAPPPTDVSNQTAGVTNTGTGVANSGANTAIANANGSATANPAAVVACPPSGGVQAAVLCVTGPISSAGVGTGTADAQGTASTSGISQLTNIKAGTNAKVDVLQVALVINIGIGLADSGTNTAGAAGGPGVGVAGTAGIGTGNADVTGLLGSTSVIQGVTLAGGIAAGQTVTVLNLGLGVGNTGLNLAAGSVVGDGTQTVVAGGPPGSGSASIGTGGARAVGDQSGSLIMQVVSVTAADDGTITVTQRAVIINFGLALANSGGNTAASALAALPDAQKTMVEGLIAALFGIDPALLFGGGSATIDTGKANAIGNSSQSSVRQLVDGAVSGSQVASADQSAWIGNFGAALANTGANGAAGTLARLPDGSPIASAEQTVARFLNLLFHPEGLASSNTQLMSALDLGAALLKVRGDIAATELLAGVHEGSAFESSHGGVRVRQVNGVLNIGISLANSGDNTAYATASGVQPQHPSPNGVSQALGTARITTGDAKVLGERATVVVCQIKGSNLELCAPPQIVTPVAPPVTPVAPPLGAPTVVGDITRDAATPDRSVATTVGAGSLALTGGWTDLEALFGLALTGGGVLLQRRARRGR